MPAPRLCKLEFQILALKKVSAMLSLCSMLYIL
jgi:hypothetical protein